MAEDITARGAPRDTHVNDPEDMDAVADRLEAALGRIARHLDTAVPVPDLVARLDGLIVRLREVLGDPPGPARD
jgi:hypothetical protein